MGTNLFPSPGREQTTARLRSTVAPGVSRASGSPWALERFAYSAFTMESQKGDGDAEN